MFNQRLLSCDSSSSSSFDFNSILSDLDEMLCFQTIDSLNLFGGEREVNIPPPLSQVHFNATVKFIYFN